MIIVWIYIYIIFCTLPSALLPQELESKHHSSELRAWSPGCAVPESVGARVPPHGMGPQMVSTESVCLSGHCMWCSCGHGHGQTIRYDEDTYILYTNIHTYIQTYRHTNIQTYKHTNKHTYIHTDIQTDKHTDRQTNIQTYKQTYLPTYLPTYIHTYIHHIHTTNHKNQDWPPITNAPNAPPPQATGGGGNAKKQDWPIGGAGRRCTKCVYIYIHGLNRYQVVARTARHPLPPLSMLCENSAWQSLQKDCHSCFSQWEVLGSNIDAGGVQGLMALFETFGRWLFFWRTQYWRRHIFQSSKTRYTNLDLFATF